MLFIIIRGLGNQVCEICHMKVNVIVVIIVYLRSVMVTLYVGVASVRAVSAECCWISLVLWSTELDISTAIRCSSRHWQCCDQADNSVPV